MSPTSAAVTRSLVFADGGSNKFWTITLDGASHTVRFGRVGTSGQSQTKAFGDEAAARASFDKLVAEKTKKGYVDQGETAPAIAPEAAASASDSPAAGPSPKEAKAGDASGAKAAAKSSPPTARARGAAPVLDVTDAIDLRPEDWFAARFRPFAPLPLPAPPPFDRGAALAKLAGLKPANEAYDTTNHALRPFDLSWKDVRLPPRVTREEAHFWLVAATEPLPKGMTPPEFAAKVAALRTDGEIDAAGVAGRLLLLRRSRWPKYLTRECPAPLPVCLVSLLPPAEAVGLLLDIPFAQFGVVSPQRVMVALREGLRDHLFPYLDGAELDLIRARLRRDWDPEKVQPFGSDDTPLEHYLAAAVGMPAEVAAVVARVGPGRFAWSRGDHWSPVQDLLLGLGSPELVVREWRRLGPTLRDADDVRRFLACTGTLALDVVAESVVTASDRADAESKMRALALVRSPAAAPHILRCTSSKGAAVARKWLETNVGCAVAGLVETAGGSGEFADAAVEYLRWVKHGGHAEIIQHALDGASAPAADKVRREVVEYEATTYEPLDDASTPAWLAEALATVAPLKKRAFPSWASPAMLPPLLIGDRRLTDDQVDAVLRALAATAVTEKHPLLVALRGHASKKSRDDFAWKLFERWRADAFPPKEKWAMGAIGHLGDDGCVMKLTPLVRAWPGEGQSVRAGLGLECLRAVGSSTALMHLSGIAKKLSFKGLKKKAELCVEAIAAERGMTREELDDRVIPDCGLDEHGRRTFSFGPRSFLFVLGDDLQPKVRDEAGKVQSNLPKANAKDDRRLAEEAHAEWKIIKKQIAEVAKLQAARLERAMIAGRRWKVEDFEGVLLRHPLMINLARRLVWVGFDADGKRTVSFRVTEERDYADPEDDAVSLGGTAAVGIAHPLDLTDAERARWGEVMGDYEIITPFQQLARPVFVLDGDERRRETLDRVRGWTYPAPLLVYAFENMGWVRGRPLASGRFDEHARHFPASGVTAVVKYTGETMMGYIDPGDVLTVERVWFVAGERPAAPEGDVPPPPLPPLPLDRVPPIAVSEVLLDLHKLKTKAK